ncbi:MAG: hypothetical protein HYX27_02490 [Acidobacteria bacterium]|nr:hypothetical protein [Acidobacteriota bacterium]
MQCLSVKSAAKAGPSGTRWVVWTAAAIAGLFAAFLLFYTTGYVLQQLPPAWSQGAEDE